MRGRTRVLLVLSTDCSGVKPLNLRVCSPPSVWPTVQGGPTRKRVEMSQNISLPEELPTAPAAQQRVKSPSGAGHSSGCRQPQGMGEPLT